jgi:3'-5' exoribonuclease
MTAGEGKQPKLGMENGRAARRGVRDLTPGSNLAGEQYVVRGKRLTPFKTKPGQYLSLTLGDRTGDIEARAWENAETLAATFEEGDVVAVSGRVEAYKDKLQVIVGDLSRCAPEQVRREDFLATAARSPDEMLEELIGVCKSVRDPGLRKLLAVFFADGEFADRFKTAPGAKRVHHAYVGGLIEHTLNVVKICDNLCAVYPQLDRDLLVVGALLHDIGKVSEYACNLSIETTDEGELIGHIAQGYHLVAQALPEVAELTEERRLRVGHMVVAHHGEPAMGAPKEPLTVEACALHHAENLDAQVNRFLTIMEREGGQGRSWTERDFLLQRRLFLGADTAGDEG